MSTVFNAADAIAKARLRLAERKAVETAGKAAQLTAINKAMHLTIPSLSTLGWKIDNSVPWNDKQLAGINMGLSRKDFCLIGAAGTGKTTTLKGIIYSLLKNELIPPIRETEETKWLAAGSPGLVLTSFTNMAVRQIAKNFSGDITCITIHKLLEFEPVFYEVVGTDGTISKKMVFEPSRNRFNPLPRSLKTIVIDESSMVDCALFDLLVAALPDPSAVQFIFLGDLNQLPPVYGGPILGKKLLTLPIVELVDVYRQALESPIIRYAIEMKDGRHITVSEKTVIDNGEHGKVTIHPWAKPLSWEDALNKAENFCKAAIKEGVLDVYQDIILCPYNVNFGVLALNSSIADYLGRMRQAIVFEVVAGFNTHYYAVGDKVLTGKREALITKITRNGRYAGKKPIDSTVYSIDRWGGASKRTIAATMTAGEEFASAADFDVDAFLENMVTTDVENRVTASSHEVTVMFIDGHNREMAEHDRETAVLSSASEINEMLFAYAITVHKSQGSEWRKVFIVTHNSHAKMCSRELMYTAMTRAKTELYMIIEPDRGMKAGTLTSAAKKPRLKGNTLAEKLISLKERFDKEAKESQNGKTSNNQSTEESEE